MEKDIQRINVYTAIERMKRLSQEGETFSLSFRKYDRQRHSGGDTVRLNHARLRPKASDEEIENASYKLFLVVAVTNSPKHDFNRCKSATCRFLFRDTKSARDKNGTKPRKNKVKDTSPEISLVEYLCFVCKGTNLSLEKRGKSLFLSFTTHFPTIVPQMWLLQTVLTSNSMTCENRVLNFVLHSDGHFQKRELAIEPNICHPYCPIFGFVIV